MKPITARYRGSIHPRSRTVPTLAHDTTSAETLRHLLQTCRNIAIVGLSAVGHRPSYFVAKYLQQHGLRILPVNPRDAGSQILGMACVARLEDMAELVAMVDVFRKTEGVAPSADSAISIGAQCLGHQLGVRNHDADARTRAGGLRSVMNCCFKIAVVWRSALGGHQHWRDLGPTTILTRRGGLARRQERVRIKLRFTLLRS